jgi:hypothetical protein
MESFVDSPPSLIPVEVRMRDGSTISIVANRFDTVLKLKELLVSDTGLYPSQQRLIYAGKVLSNEMSLDYYNIHTGSQVYFLPTTVSNPVGQRPYQLLSKLLNLLEELPTADSRRFADIINDIREILANSTVQASARIDSDVKQLIVDAQETLSSAKRPTSRRMKLFLAQGQDRALDGYDSQGDGLRAMKSMIGDQFNEEEEEPQRTNRRYRKRISNQALPSTWSPQRRDKYSVFHASALRLSLPVSVNLPADQATPKKVTFESPAGQKSRFLKQLVALKDMGFDDETIILEALTQANGNVQLAAKLLQNRRPCK